MKGRSPHQQSKRAAQVQARPKGKPFTRGGKHKESTAKRSR